MFYDRAIIDGPARLTRDGYLVAEARVARANNIQEYRAGELGLKDRDPSSVVRVFRPESEVFARDAMASAAHRPITLDHPKEDVSSANWRALAVGDIGGDVIRDGEFLRVPLKIMDSGAVRAAQTTHQEFSLGYSADLRDAPGEFNGQPYDFVMGDLKINHLALCGTARGGAELRIVDERPPHLRETTTMKITIGDAKDVDLSDGAAVALAVGALNTTLADTAARATTAENTVAAHVATIAAKDAEIATLTQAVKDATLTPQQKVEAGKAFAKLVADAQKLAPKAGITDAMDEAQIRKAAVSAKLGDAAKDFTDAQIETAFATSIALIGDATPQADPLRIGIMQQPINVGDAQANYAAGREKQKAAMRDGWKTPFNAADAAAA